MRRKAGGAEKILQGNRKTCKSTSGIPHYLAREWRETRLWRPRDTQKLLNGEKIALQGKSCVGFCSCGNCQQWSASRWRMKTAVDVPVFFTYTGSQKIPPCHQRAARASHSFPGRRPAAAPLPRRYFWSTPDNPPAIRGAEPNEHWCVFLSCCPSRST